MEARVAMRLVGSCDVLSKDAIKEVQHFLDHGEWEMAFEGLVLELIAMGRVPDSHERAAWECLGRDLGLDKGSVFEPGFWQKFMEWIKGEAR